MLPLVNRCFTQNALFTGRTGARKNFSQFGKALAFSERRFSRFFETRTCFCTSKKAEKNAATPCKQRSFTQFPQGFPQAAANRCQKLSVLSDFGNLGKNRHGFPTKARIFTFSRIFLPTLRLPDKICLTRADKKLLTKIFLCDILIKKYNFSYFSHKGGLFYGR